MKYSRIQIINVIAAGVLERLKINSPKLLKLLFLIFEARCKLQMFRFSENFSWNSPFVYCLCEDIVWLCMSDDHVTVFLYFRGLHWTAFHSNQQFHIKWKITRHASKTVKPSSSSSSSFSAIVLFALQPFPLHIFLCCAWLNCRGICIEILLPRGWQ